MENISSLKNGNIAVEKINIGFFMNRVDDIDSAGLSGLDKLNIVYDFIQEILNGRFFKKSGNECSVIEKHVRQINSGLPDKFAINLEEMSVLKLVELRDVIIKVQKGLSLKYVREMNFKNCKENEKGIEEKEMMAETLGKYLISGNLFKEPKSVLASGNDIFNVLEMAVNGRELEWDLGKLKDMTVFTSKETLQSIVEKFKSKSDEEVEEMISGSALGKTRGNKP